MYMYDILAIFDQSWKKKERKKEEEEKEEEDRKKIEKYFKSSCLRELKKTIGVLPGLLIGRYTLSVSCFPAHELEWRAFDKTSFWAVLAENKREDP